MVEQGHHTGMLELVEDEHLAPDAGHGRAPGVARGLQGHLLTGLGVLRPIDHAHGALTKALDQAVGADEVRVAAIGLRFLDGRR